MKINWGKKSKNNIFVNGKAYSVNGNNISIINNKVYVDGKEINTDEKLSGEITIRFEGDLANLQCDCPVIINGNVKGDVDSKGSINCENVYGNLKSYGSVNCRDVHGDLTAYGSVHKS
jgi:hypothetical protein